MKILVIDGQGGGIGSGIIQELRRCGIENAEILAVGTNVMATSAKCARVVGVEPKPMQAYLAEAAEEVKKLASLIS